MMMTKDTYIKAFLLILIVTATTAYCAFITLPTIYDANSMTVVVAPNYDSPKPYDIVMRPEPYDVVMRPIPRGRVIASNVLMVWKEVTNGDEVWKWSTIPREMMASIENGDLAEKDVKIALKELGSIQTCRNV